MIRRGRPFLAVLASLALAAPVHAADDPAWVVGKTASSPKAMVRTIGNVTIDYHVVPGDTDSASITVTGCGDEPWSMNEGLDHVTAGSLRQTVGELFTNARLNCPVADGLEQRFLTGFDAAFQQVKPTAAPHVQTVAGWTLDDRGSHPGDDSDRIVTMTKALPFVELIYRPGETDGASLTINFKLCDGLNFNTGFDFGNPPENHAKVVNDQVTEAYADFAKRCKARPQSQAELMQGFPEALGVLEQWLKDKPFTYPPEPASDTSASTDPAS